MLRDPIRYDPFNPNEEQVGYWGLSDIGKNIPFKIENLKGAKIYNVTIMYADLNGNFTVLFDQQINTPLKMEVYTIRVKVSLQKSIGQFQLKAIACYLTSYFNLRYYM